MTIYLDFDGTVVEHLWPKMGRCNFGCFEIIKKLQDAGHQIILNTYRADANDGTLEQALKMLNENAWMFFADRTSDLQHVTHLPAKITAGSWDLEGWLKRGEMFIDDQCTGTPLKPAAMTTGQMVDWNALDKIFETNGLYKKKCDCGY